MTEGLIYYLDLMELWIGPYTHFRWYQVLAPALHHLL